MSCHLPEHRWTRVRRFGLLVRAVVSCPPCCEAELVTIVAILPKRAPLAQSPPVWSKKAETAPPMRPYLR